MVMVLGTSTCHMLLAERHAKVEGIGGVVRDGIVEGFAGYEAGQPAVGDIFGWFAKLVGGGAGGLRRSREGGGSGAAGRPTGSSRSTGGTGTARCSSTRTSRASSWA